MKIRLEHNGDVFEFERPPLPEGRFKAICKLAAAGLYMGLVLGIAVLCGIQGVIAAAVVTGIIAVFFIMSL